MRRSPVGKPTPVAVLLLACLVAVGGCRDEGGRVDPDPDGSAGRTDVLGDAPQSLADLDAIVESNRPDDGSALQEQAIQLIRDGDTLGAERWMLGRVTELDRIIDHALENFRIEAERGTYSPAYRRLRER